MQTGDAIAHRAGEEVRRHRARALVRAHRELLLNYFRAKKLFSSGVIEGLNSQSHTEKSIWLSDAQDRRALAVSRARQATGATNSPTDSSDKAKNQIPAYGSVLPH